METTRSEEIKEVFLKGTINNRRPVSTGWPFLKFKTLDKHND
jgi:hypothetical protein